MYSSSNRQEKLSAWRNSHSRYLFCRYAAELLGFRRRNVYNEEDLHANESSLTDCRQMLTKCLLRQSFFSVAANVSHVLQYYYARRAAIPTLQTCEWLIARCFSNRWLVYSILKHRLIIQHGVPAIIRREWLRAPFGSSKKFSSLDSTIGKSRDIHVSIFRT